MPVETAYPSLGSLLAEVQSLVPQGLIGEAGWEKVQALTTRLPACAAESRFGFEFDLFEPDPTADFCVLLMPGSPITDFYEQQVQTTGPALAGPGFQEFLKEQTGDPHSFLVRTGAGIVLEYDLAQSPAGQHEAPGVFIVTSSTAERKNARLHDDLAELVTALESAADWRPGVIDMGEVKRVWGAAPGAAIAQAGVMPGRHHQAVRLILQGIASEEVGETLKRLEWPGDASLAVGCLSELSELIVPQPALSLDVNPWGVSPRLGLELFRPVEWYRTDPSGWRSLIECLNNKGWCLAAKAQALTEWPRVETFFGRDGVYRVRQVINHVKLLVHNGNVSVKGYAALDVRRTAANYPWLPV